MIDTLNKDDTIMVLPANKVQMTVVTKKGEYLEKCNKLLKDIKTYLKLNRDSVSTEKEL